MYVVREIMTERRKAIKTQTKGSIIEHEIIRRKNVLYLNKPLAVFDSHAFIDFPEFRASD